MKKDKKKVFVTGASGFVGRHWCKKLLSEGNIVYAMDLKETYKDLLKFNNFHFYKRSVFDYGLVQRLVKKTDITCHFAGIASPNEYLYNTHKVIDLTVNPSLKIIEYCNRFKKKLFFTSTSEIYGKSYKIPFFENDDRLLGSTSTKRWCYSTSKALVEHSIFANLNKKKGSFIIFRLFNVYGKGLQGRVVDGFIGNALKNKDLKIYGTGKQTRSFLYIDDCIEIFYRIFRKRNLENQVVNIGNNKETSIKKLATLTIELTKSKSKINYIKMNSKNKMKRSGYEDISRRVPSIIRQKKITKYSPKISLRIGLKKFIADYKKEI